MCNNISSLGEFGLIDRLRPYQNLSRKVVKGIGDDTAVLALDKKRYQLFSTDMLVEDVHFTREMSPSSVGHKALACSISDIAAMGGQPAGAVISLGLPGNLEFSYIEKIYRGMHAAPGISA